MRLEIPYPKTGGPGGNFHIVGSYTPIARDLCAVFHWRCRPLTGWQRDTWRFLYRNRLEVRHWAVLEQDREMLEFMEPDANQRENLYQHDLGLVPAAAPEEPGQGPAGTDRGPATVTAVRRIQPRRYPTCRMQAGPMPCWWERSW